MESKLLYHYSSYFLFLAEGVFLSQQLDALEKTPRPPLIAKFLTEHEHSGYTLTPFRAKGNPRAQAYFLIRNESIVAVIYLRSRNSNRIFCGVNSKIVGEILQTRFPMFMVLLKEDARYLLDRCQIFEIMENKPFVGNEYKINQPDIPSSSEFKTIEDFEVRLVVHQKNKMKFSQTIFRGAMLDRFRSQEELATYGANRLGVAKT